jgi:hypothetical protein
MTNINRVTFQHTQFQVRKSADWPCIRGRQDVDVLSLLDSYLKKELLYVAGL